MFILKKAKKLLRLFNNHNAYLIRLCTTIENTQRNEQIRVILVSNIMSPELLIHFASVLAFN